MWCGPQLSLPAENASLTLSQGSEEGLHLQWLLLLNIKLLHSQGTVKVVIYGIVSVVICTVMLWVVTQELRRDNFISLT
jgi:hypothetical protein